MYQTFLLFSIISSVVAIAALAIIIVILICSSFPNGKLPMLDEMFKYLRYCRISSLIFIVFASVMVAGEPMEIDRNLYQKISDICLYMGKVWIFAALANIFLSIICCLKKDPETLIKVFNKTRASAFMMGIIFFILSYVLNV